MNRLSEYAIKAAFWLGGLIVLVAAMSFDVFDNFFIVVAAIMAMGFVSTLFHEVGHAWMASRRGAQVELIAVFPFGFSPTRRSLELMKEKPGGDLAGYVSYAFPEGGSTRRDEMAIAAAGPVADFLVAGLLIFAITLWPVAGTALSPVNDDLAPLAVVAAEDAPPGLDRAPPQVLPSEAELQSTIEQVKARERAEYRSAIGAALLRLLIVISIVSGVLNLLPYRGSDGGLILEHLRWYRRMKGRWR